LETTFPARRKMRDSREVRHSTSAFAKMEAYFGQCVLTYKASWDRVLVVPVLTRSSLSLFGFRVASQSEANLADVPLGIPALTSMLDDNEVGKKAALSARRLEPTPCFVPGQASMIHTALSSHVQRHG